MWKPKFSGAKLLFFMNRYITPLQFIIIIDGGLFLPHLPKQSMLTVDVAFEDPIWTKSVSGRGDSSQLKLNLIFFLCSVLGVNILVPHCPSSLLN